MTRHQRWSCPTHDRMQTKWYLRNLLLGWRILIGGACGFCRGRFHRMRKQLKSGLVLLNLWTGVLDAHWWSALAALSPL